MLGDEFGIAAVKFRLYEDDMYIFAAAGINQGFQMCRRRFFATGFDGNLMQSVVAGEIRECRVVNHKGMVCAGGRQRLPYEAVGMFYLPAKSIIAFQIKIFVAFVDIT